MSGDQKIEVGGQRSLCDRCTRRPVCGVAQFFVGTVLRVCRSFYEVKTKGPQ